MGVLRCSKCINIFLMHFEWILWAILIIYLWGLKMQQNWFIANNPLGSKEFKNNWYSKWSESAISHFLWYQCTKIKNETVSCHEVVLNYVNYQLTVDCKNLTTLIFDIFKMSIWYVFKFLRPLLSWFVLICWKMLCSIKWRHTSLECSMQYFLLLKNSACDVAYIKKASLNYRIFMQLTPYFQIMSSMISCNTNPYPIILWILRISKT